MDEELKALIQRQIKDIAQLRACLTSSVEFKRWSRITSNLLKRLFGDNPRYLEFQRIVSPPFGVMGFQDWDEAQAFLEEMLFEIETFWVTTWDVGGATATSLALQIKDQELRDRCIDLLTSPAKYDRAVRAACVILEHRVRTTIKAPNHLLGVDLMSDALRKDDGALILSDHPGEQEGAHLLYRGIVAFLKNPTSHRLITSYSRHRAVEVIGFIDFFLDILQEARRRGESNEQPG